MPVLEFIEKISDAGLKKEAMDTVNRAELEAAKLSFPSQGAEDLVSFIRSKGLKAGIITRNSRQSILSALENFEKIGPEDFDLIISRDDGIKPKPSGDGILLAAERFQVEASEILVAGDFLFDIQAGNSAGAITAYLDHATRPEKVESDFTVNTLEDLKTIVRLGIGLPAGKLPNDLLAMFLDKFDFDDPSLLIHAGIGEDIAAVADEDMEVLVLKTDPITFVTDSIGRYTVVINANDIATSGATPRWLLTTLLFPCNTTPSQIWHAMHELEYTCRQWNIPLCGGHTEITDAVRKPVITGLMAGTVKRAKMIRKANMRKGDLVLFTKRVAVEGTAILAGEFEHRLKELGLTENEIRKAKDYIFQLSIMEEARIAADTGNVSAMHDVTEGGLATALEELSIAGGKGIRIDFEKIPVYPITEKICRFLNIDPMGLIGSGSLLICCRPEAYEKLRDGIRKAGIAVTCIGEVLDRESGIKARKNGRPMEWPRFDTDEITRLSD